MSGLISEQAVDVDFNNLETRNKVFYSDQEEELPTLSDTIMAYAWAVSELSKPKEPFDQKLNGVFMFYDFNNIPKEP